MHKWQWECEYKNPHFRSFVDELQKEKIIYKEASKHCRYLPFVIYCSEFYSFGSFSFSTVHKPMVI